MAVAIVAPVFGRMVKAKSLKQIASRTTTDPNADKPAVTTKPMAPQKTSK